MAYSHWVYSSTRKPTNGPFLKKKIYVFFLYFYRLNILYMSFSGFEPDGNIPLYH